MIKQMFDKPKEAVYFFETMNVNRSLLHWNVAVYVLGTTDKSYLIQLKQPARNHAVGDKIWVKKKKVRIMEINDNVSEYWYNNFESRELFQ